MRKIVAVAAIAGALLIATPIGASAEDVPTPGPASPTIPPYPPRTPTEPTLAGSTAVGECDADVPWIHYTVTLTDPDQLSTSHTARLTITDGTNSTTIPLGDLVNNQLSGSVLWPGASTDANGVANGWPGWVFQNGEWVETTGNFRWTRGNITARIDVNPELSVPLSYPPATPICATDPHNPGKTLPATGLNSAVLPIGIAGGVVALAGVGLLAARRRTRS